MEQLGGRGKSEVREEKEHEFLGKQSNTFCFFLKKISGTRSGLDIIFSITNPHLVEVFKTIPNIFPFSGNHA